MNTDTKKVTHSVKPHITHQMKSYSNVKTILGSIYIYYKLVAGLGQVNEMWPKYTKYLIEIHRKSSKW